ncbi:cyclin-dependent kinase-like 2 isoform X2 [Heterodontus francisci]|uniref:cyclin-dependent kinase-like 2 isoform X2 n=1 Tax=Heterodontus francisci TaxID=7792 RepID=UPI00355C53A0
MLTDMEKYEHLGLVGEGSYGMVIKCRNKENGRIVAIKKFLEDDDDKMVKKIAMREIRLLKQLRHENLVNLLEVCKRKKRWYLVFEFVDHTVLDDLERFPNGLEYDKVRKYLIQILRGTAFCHSHNVIHRDIKPENILVSESGMVKLCDFGFARTLAAPGEIYTDYVATRWYRAPELLVGDTKYGKSVDVWAVGCLVTEMMTGEPLFPGDSDIDQLYHIIKCFGNLTPRHQELFYKNPLFTGLHLPVIKEVELLQNRYPKISFLVLDLVKCLQIDPEKRPSCVELLEHNYFTTDGFSERFTQELVVQSQKDLKDNLPLPKRSKIGKKDIEELSADKKKSVTNSKDEDVESMNKDRKSDRKLPKTRASKVESEKAAKLERALDDWRENIVDSGTFRGLGSSKVTFQGLGKEQRSRFECPKSPADTIIPSIAQNPSIVNSIALGVALSSGIGVSGQHSFRVQSKMKRHVNSLRKRNQPPPATLFSLYLNSQHQQEKTERSVQLERPQIMSKKKWETSKSEREDVRLPELSSWNHLPELKAAEAKHSKIRKESRKIPESKIPTLAAVELIHQPSLASQSSLSSLQECAGSNFPRVKQFP